MRAVVLDGALSGDPVFRRIRCIVESELSGLSWETTQFLLDECDIAPCAGCRSCWCATPGRCEIRDDAETILKAIVKSDLLVFLTPLTFGGYSSILKNFVDRMPPLVSPFFIKKGDGYIHKGRYPMPPRMVGIGMLATMDMESVRVFSSLVGVNAARMQAPAHASVVLSGRHSQGLLAENIRNALARVEVTR